MTDFKKKPLVIVAGPTAVGKSEIAIKLAGRINGGIVSADSMQVYRGMDIGTAKLKPDEMGDIPHYLIDILEPDEEFHVVKFQGLARCAIDELYALGKLPILCGGTGFYIQSLLYEIDFTAESGDESLRRELTALAEKEGSAALHRILKELDPAAAEKIHPNNTKRLIRAIEFFKLSGSPISEHNEVERAKAPAYDAVYFCLTMNREKLYRRIDARVDAMLEQGLVGEVQALREKGYSRDLVSMQGLGYKEMLSYLDGEIDYDEAVRLIKQGSRHFAKRQLTWMNREPDAIMLDRGDYPDDDALLTKMLEILSEKGIIK